MVQVQGPSPSGSVNDAFSVTDPNDRRILWSGPAFTTGGWSCGGAVQEIEKLTGVVLPAVTATACGLVPLTLQFDGIGLSPTEWFATLRPLNVTEPLAATD